MSDIYVLVSIDVEEKIEDISRYVNKSFISKQISTATVRCVGHL